MRNVHENNNNTGKGLLCARFCNDFTYMLEARFSPGAASPFATINSFVRRRKSFSLSMFPELYRGRNY
jgi:archaellum biogenesis ATPase FlaH